MTKIKEVFETIKAEDRKALINYIVVGDPDLKTTLEVMKVMVNEGVDIIELGIPFSDPMADGPSVQASSLRALNNGMTLKKTLGLKNVVHISEPDEKENLTLTVHYVTKKSKIKDNVSFQDSE